MMKLKTILALAAIEQHSPHSYAWLQNEITQLEAENLKLKTGLLLAAANEAERTKKQETQYDQYLLPVVTHPEVTA